jgi:hypothetical protein
VVGMASRRARKASSVLVRGRWRRASIGELVVVAVVAEGGGALGKVAEVGLVLLFEKGVLRGEAVGHGLTFWAKSEPARAMSVPEKQAMVKAHPIEYSVIVNRLGQPLLIVLAACDC